MELTITVSCDKDIDVDKHKKRLDEYAQDIANQCVAAGEASDANETELPFVVGAGKFILGGSVIYFAASHDRGSNECSVDFRLTDENYKQAIDLHEVNMLTKGVNREKDLRLN